MRAQLQRLGMTFNWDREVTTCAPEYYKWTQWLFLQMMDAGYAYRREAEVNWDPVDRTVLANEQVDADGRSWRSGAPIERRTLSQWFLRITDLASDLDAGIAEVRRRRRHLWRARALTHRCRRRLLLSPVCAAGGLA